MFHSVRGVPRGKMERLPVSSAEKRAFFLFLGIQQNMERLIINQLQITKIETVDNQYVS